VKALSPLEIRTLAGRLSLYEYMRNQYPRFFTPNKPHLRSLCDTLQAFVEDKLLDATGQPVRNLMLNVPPRHGKTLSVIGLVQWELGRDPLQSYACVSYNEKLSGRFARGVRDAMQEVKAGPRLVYGDYFPRTKVKAGDGGYETWSVDGSPFSFLATSPGGTLTGVGCTRGIIDDIVKSSEEAFNENTLEGHWDWYVNTFLSRLEAGAKQLIIMTRWATGDLCGKLLEREPEKWHVILMPANTTGAETPTDADMLCPAVLDAATYIERREKTDPVIHAANYDQKPYDSTDKLYPALKTYRIEDAPKFQKVENYTDTADEGDDYLCSISYGVASGLAYILDVIYTQDAMETTEPQTARMLTERKVQRAHIESNNGGRGFARAVEKILRANGNSQTMVEWFHQSENKAARILSNAASVGNCVLFPEGWQYRWPKFYADVTRAGRGVKWTHDDAFDALTGIVEKSLTRPAFAIL